VVPAERFAAFAVAVRAFECTVDDGALLHGAFPVFPAKSDVHHEVEYPKRFTAFGRPVDKHQPGNGDEFIH